MSFVENDGGRSAYFKGSAGDCVTRAIAIATEQDYLEVYNRLGEMIGEWSKGRSRAAKAWREKGKGATARNRTPKDVSKQYMEQETNWVWTPCKGIGSTATADEIWASLPSGRLILATARHWVAMVDGEIQDTWDSSDSQWGDTKRIVYGYWMPPAKTDPVVDKIVEKLYGPKPGIRRRRRDPSMYERVQTEETSELLGAVLSEEFRQQHIILVRELPLDNDADHVYMVVPNPKKAQ